MHCGMASFTTSPPREQDQQDSGAEQRRRESDVHPESCGHARAATYVGLKRDGAGPLTAITGEPRVERARADGQADCGSCSTQ